MANTPKRMALTQLTTSNATLYTVPAATTTILKSMDFVNTSSSAATLTVYVVPTGGSASAANALISGRSIAGNDNLGWEGEMVLNAGDFIVAVAGTTSVINAFLNGVELT